VSTPEKVIEFNDAVLLRLRKAADAREYCRGCGQLIYSLEASSHLSCWYGSAYPWPLSDPTSQGAA
jgi:hypothetical protein